VKRLFGPSGGAGVYRLGVGLYALFAWLSTALLSVSSTMIVIAALADRGFRAFVTGFRDNGVWWLIAAYILSDAGRGAWLWPETMEAQWRAASAWLKLLVFLPLAWWLRIARERAEKMLFLVLIGWWIGVVLHIDWPAWSRFDFFARTGFQLDILLSGIVAGIVILGLTLLVPHHFRASSRRDWVLLAGRGLAGATALLVLFVAQSRGAWLAFLLVFPLAVAWRVVSPRPGRAMQVVAARMALALVVAAPFLGLASLSLQLRWVPEPVAIPMPAEVGQSPAGAVKERPDMAAVIGQRVFPQSDISFRLRYAVQNYGLEKWAERPFLGWGPGATEWLIQQSRRSELRNPDKPGLESWIRHFHNTGLEILVQFGLVGVLLFGAALVLVFARLWRAYRHGGLDRSMFLFIAGALLMFVVMSLTNFNLLHPESRALLVLLLGLAWGHGRPPGEKA
jgi:O-antigen ligase